MKIMKSVVSVAVAGLIVSGNALAMPGFTQQAPFSSIEICIRQISDQADYHDAARVRHAVDSEERRIGGHTIKIETQVFGADGAELIREYATVCTMSSKQETQHFVLKQKRL